MDKKQKKFEEIYEKFFKKCLQENLLPTAVIRYERTGMLPEITYMEVTDEQKKDILSSLDKSSK